MLVIQLISPCSFSVRQLWYDSQHEKNSRWEANKLKQKLLSLIAAAAIFLTIAATTVQAEQIAVHKGDTLWGLSKQYGVSVESIKKWNNLSSDLIHPNDLLEVSPVKYVSVNKGDSLQNIAQVNGVSLRALKKWNNLSSDVLNPGSNLIIYKNRQNNINVEIASATPAPAVNPEKKGKEITVTATAYTAECTGCIGITKTGVNLKANPDAKVIAVDPSVIPLGSKVHVEGYGVATAEDIGGAIKGNRIDVFIPEHGDALEWGRKQVKLTIID